MWDEVKDKLFTSGLDLIDTWACGGGWLTCLDVYGGQIWQTNQQGQVRMSRIEEFRPTASSLTP